MKRIDRLIELRDILDAAIMECESKRDLAALARQYRETLKEIDDIEGADNGDDEIAEILEGLQTDGKPRAVRKNRA